MISVPLGDANPAVDVTLIVPKGKVGPDVIVIAVATSTTAAVWVVLLTILNVWPLASVVASGITKYWTALPSKYNVWDDDEVTTTGVVADAVKRWNDRLFLVVPIVPFWNNKSFIVILPLVGTMLRLYVVILIFKA
jgi:hypothetical protein